MESPCKSSFGSYFRIRLSDHMKIIPFYDVNQQVCLLLLAIITSFILDPVKELSRLSPSVPRFSTSELDVTPPNSETNDSEMMSARSDTSVSSG